MSKDDFGPVTDAMRAALRARLRVADAPEEQERGIDDCEYENDPMERVAMHDVPPACDELERLLDHESGTPVAEAVRNWHDFVTALHESVCEAAAVLEDGLGHGDDPPWVGEAGQTYAYLMGNLQAVLTSVECFDDMLGDLHQHMHVAHGASDWQRRANDA